MEARQCLFRSLVPSICLCGSGSLFYVCHFGMLLNSCYREVIIYHTCASFNVFDFYLLSSPAIVNFYCHFGGLQFGYRNFIIYLWRMLIFVFRLGPVYQVRKKSVKELSLCFCAPNFPPECWQAHFWHVFARI